MEVTCVKAAERFDNVELDNAVDWLDKTAKSIYAIYTCPRCGEKIRFQKDDFQKAWTRHDWTNLPQDVARSFDQYAHEHGLDSKHYLDWQCPKCNLAARVLVEPWAGGRHGDAGFDLHSVLEYFV